MQGLLIRIKTTSFLSERKNDPLALSLSVPTPVLLELLPVSLSCFGYRIWRVYQKEKKIIYSTFYIFIYIILDYIYL